jgi:glycerophosphoryl diester phosphodiesterase
MGVDGLEFDIQLSGDGALVVHHDARLKPEATRRNGQFLHQPTARLDTLSLAELSSYDVGTLKKDSPYGRRRADRANFDNLRIPTLSALEALVVEHAPAEFKLYTELKTDMGSDPTQALELAEAYLRYLETAPMADNHIAVSFDWRCLNRLRAARPDMPHAYTTLEFHLTDPTHASAAHDTQLQAAIRAASATGAPWFDGFDWRDMEGDSHAAKMLGAMHSAKAKGWFGEQNDITAQHMAMASDFGLDVSAWTVNAADDMRQCIGLGVGAIITDRPDILIAL